MPLTCPSFDFTLADDADTYRVEIRPADQIVAEQTAARLGLGEMSATPLSHTYLWVWAAARRSGIHADEWPTFRDRLAAVEPVRDINGDPAATVVDPTAAVTTA